MGAAVRREYLLATEATVISTSRLRKEHEQFYNQTKLFE